MTSARGRLGGPWRRRFDCGSRGQRRCLRGGAHRGAPGQHVEGVLRPVGKTPCDRWGRQRAGVRGPRGLCRQVWVKGLPGAREAKLAGQGDILRGLGGEGGAFGSLKRRRAEPAGKDEEENETEDRAKGSRGEVGSQGGGLRNHSPRIGGGLPFDNRPNMTAAAVGGAALPAPSFKGGSGLEAVP